MVSVLCIVVPAVGLLAVALAGTPTTDEGCGVIGGVCKNINAECGGGNKYYEQLCSGDRSRYCCARRTDETRCANMGGQCDYNCVGSRPHAGLCEGHLSCCIALF